MNRERMRVGESIRFDNVTIVAPDNLTLLSGEFSLIFTLHSTLRFFFFRGICLRRLTAPELSFEIRPGANVLISGPPGCGKSALFRALFGLWSIPSGIYIYNLFISLFRLFWMRCKVDRLTPETGVITRPSGKHEVLYVGSRPYFAASSLRDTVIFPDARTEMFAKGLPSSRPAH
jgi:ABC-type uncharacterized transport system fused permease/ATPase subunit